MFFSDFLSNTSSKLELNVQNNIHENVDEKMVKTFHKRISVLLEQNKMLLTEAQHSSRNLKEIVKILQEASKKKDIQEIAEVLVKTQPLNRMKMKDDPIDIDLSNFAHSAEQFLKDNK